jgi:hypothetical protein
MMSFIVRRAAISPIIAGGKSRTSEIARARIRE